MLQIKEAIPIHRHQLVNIASSIFRNLFAISHLQKIHFVFCFILQSEQTDSSRMGSFQGGVCSYHGESHPIGWRGLRTAHGLTEPPVAFPWVAQASSLRIGMCSSFSSEYWACIFLSVINTCGTYLTRCMVVNSAVSSQCFIWILQPLETLVLDLPANPVRLRLKSGVSTNLEQERRLQFRIHFSSLFCGSNLVKTPRRPIASSQSL